jgi:hypothetical protein
VSLRGFRSHHVALLLLLLVFTFGSAMLADAGPSGMDEGAVPSTDNRAFGGLRGLYLTARSLDMEVETWRRPTDLLDQSVGAMVTVEALESRPAGGDLLEWTKGGGRLLLSSSTDLGPPWTTVGLQSRGRGGFRPVTFHGAAADWCAPEALDSSSRGFLEPLPPGARVLATVSAGSDSAPWLVEVPVGEGTLLALADARVLTNDRLQEEEAAVAAIRMLEHLAQDDAVVFCETIHGSTTHADPTAAFLHMLGTTPLGLACIAASLFFLLFLVTGAPRFGRVRHTREPARRSEHEYLEALGGLMRHERAWIDVGAFLREGLRRRMDPGGRSEGPPDDDEIVRGLAWDRPGDRAAIAADVEILARGERPTAMLGAMQRLDTVLARDREHLGGDEHDTR